MPGGKGDGEVDIFDFFFLVGWLLVVESRLVCRCRWMETNGEEKGRR